MGDLKTPEVDMKTSRVVQVNAIDQSEKKTKVDTTGDTIFKSCIVIDHSDYYPV